MGYLVLPLLKKGIIHLFIYKVRAREEHEKEGSQFFLHPRTHVSFCLRVTRDFSRLPQKAKKGKLTLKLQRTGNEYAAKRRICKKPDQQK